MVALSAQERGSAGVSKTATFSEADLFETDFSKADVVTMFLLPSINMRLRPTILEHEARHAHRHQHIQHGRLGRGPEGNIRKGLRQLVHGTAVDRPRQGGRHLGPSAARRSPFSRSFRC